jgi:murein DD-endopeptidase MepM/ murein hydrolase activator NlpD
MSENTRQYAKKNETKEKNPFSRKPDKDFSESASSPFAQVLHLQRTIGNKAVTRLIQSGSLQAKLKISPPNDIYEQEADRVAEQVMRMPEPKQSLVNNHSSLVQRESTFPECEEKEAEGIQAKPLVEQITPLVQRQMDEEEDLQAKPMIQRQENEEEEEQAQLKGAPGGTPEVSPGIESNINSMKGGGQPLSESSRSFFESRFGANFSQVRVHTESKAAQTAQAINAKAFTTGKDIVFGSGQYSPGTSSGKRLLAHELTHTIQQRAKIDLRYGQETISRKEVKKPVKNPLGDPFEPGYNWPPNKLAMATKNIIPLLYSTKALGFALLRYEITNKNLCSTCFVNRIFLDNLDRIYEEYYLRQKSNFSLWGTFKKPAKGRIYSSFGPRDIEVKGKKLKYHYGIDISKRPSLEVYAASGGIVMHTGTDRDYGETTKIYHGTRNGEKLVTFYAHLEKIGVTSGQCVSEGQVIGKMGNTGRLTTGTHLHFAILRNGSYIDPEPRITR